MPSEMKSGVVHVRSKPGAVPARGSRISEPTNALDMIAVLTKDVGKVR
jgi:hypothetical protein